MPVGPFEEEKVGVVHGTTVTKVMCVPHQNIAFIEDVATRTRRLEHVGVLATLEHHDSSRIPARECSLLPAEFLPLRLTPRYEKLCELRTIEIGDCNADIFLTTSASAHWIKGER